MNRTVLGWLLFPGAVFVGCGAIAAGWLERKLAARMEYRTGPPPLQILYDWIKLAVKRSDGHRSPVRSLAAWVAPAAAFAFSMLVWQSAFFPVRGFRGDFFVWMACFAAASLLPDLLEPRNGGNGRRGPGDFDLRLSSEIPLFIAWGAPFLSAGGSFRVSDVIAGQRVYGPALFSLTGVLAFGVSFVALFSALRPSGTAAAREGVPVEGDPPGTHPGFRIALSEMSRLMLLFSAPEAAVLLFAGGPGRSSSGRLLPGLLYAVLLILLTAVPSLGPRRTRTGSLRMHLGPLTLTALAAVGLTLIGR
jgi:NADH-quinone oxidoreductase subunit H